MAEDQFGTYEELEFDGSWDYQAKEPALAKQPYNFIIKSVERKYNPEKGSIGYQFTLQPYQDQFGQPIMEQSILDSRIKTYMYLGTVTNGKIYESPYANTLKVFLISIDVNPMVTGKWNVSNDQVMGIVINAPVEWEKVLSKQPNPKTGITPSAIDDNDPFSYYWATHINNNQARGLRDKNGKVVKVS